VKGVVSEDGHVTCPWHGACFDTLDGSIENAPALDYISAFHVEARDGSVYVRGDEAALKHGSRTPDLSVALRSGEKVIVVGGGSGALGAVEGLREKGYTGQVTVISKEGYLPIDRTKLSKALIPDVNKVTWRTTEFYNAAGIDFHLEKEVQSVDFGCKTLKTKDGEEHSYDKVIFATGGTPRRLPMQGFKTLGNVFVLRDMNDVKAILNAVGDNGKKVVIIGAPPSSQTPLSLH
jgi:NADPH-dependent glutamate synthase beta subunit-like oxidoreductase